MIGAEEAEVMSISEEIYDLLAGCAPDILGAICADLVARWLVGHSVPGDIAATEDIREKLLATHIEFVRKLIPATEAELYGQQ